MVRGSKISVSPQFFVFAALMLLAVPLPWLAAWFFATLVHELCHCLSLRLYGKEIERFSIGINGARIETQSLTDRQAIICALAGPIGGLLLLLCAKAFPRLAICGFIQSAFNLIPVYPLDGGRAVRGIINMLFPPKVADKICAVIEALFLLGGVALSLTATFIWKLGIIPLILTAFLALRLKKIKIPCK